jgi:hypothetical protein
MRRFPSRTPRDFNLSTFQSPTALFVEGPDEFHFFRFLDPKEVQIHAYVGKDNLKTELETYFQIEGFDQLRKVVIVRDSNGNPQGALDSVWSQWAAAFKVHAPRLPAETWQTDPEGRQWAVWLLPDPGTPGDLEELLWRAVPAGEHRTCVEQLITCLEQSPEAVPFGAKTKARFYAWLATQKDPVKDLYVALTPAGPLLDRMHREFAHIKGLWDDL